MSPTARKIGRLGQFSRVLGGKPVHFAARRRGPSPRCNNAHGISHQAPAWQLSSGDETPRRGDSTLHGIKTFVIDADVSLAIGILIKVFLHGRSGHSVFGSVLDG